MSLPRPHWWLDDSDTPAPTPVTWRPHLTDATARLAEQLADADHPNPLRPTVTVNALGGTR